MVHHHAWSLLVHTDGTSTAGHVELGEDWEIYIEPGENLQIILWKWIVRVLSILCTNSVYTYTSLKREGQLIISLLSLLLPCPVQYIIACLQLCKHSDTTVKRQSFCLPVLGTYNNKSILSSCMVWQHFCEDIRPASTINSKTWIVPGYNQHLDVWFNYI